MHLLPPDGFVHWIVVEENADGSAHWAVSPAFCELVGNGVSDPAASF
jgi:hypothetical protein